LHSKRPERLRLFFALWPDAATRHRLGQLAQQVAGPRERPVANRNLHLTLAFLGGIDHNRLDAVHKAADTVATDTLSVTLDTLELWPRPRIICLTPSAPPNSLQTLVSDLTGALGLRNLPVDDRPFKPHVTLLRHADPNHHMPQMEMPLRWTADGFRLIASRTTQTGPVYTPIGQWPVDQDGAV